MIQSQRQFLRHSAAANSLFPPLSPLPFSGHLKFPPTNHHSHSSSSLSCSAHKAVWLAHLSEQLTAMAVEEGPTEIRSTVSSIIAANESKALQTATSVLFTIGFTLFLFRSLRRRARRAKQTRFRSTGANKSSKEEAMETLKTMSKSLGRKAKSPPSPDQAFLGAVIAAAFGVLLYKFTTTVEYSLNQQTLSANYSVRQITITIRTIINGLCYLATFVFGFNSLGLFLYSGQLAMNSFVEDPNNESEAPLNSSFSKSRDVDSSGTNSASEDQSSDKTHK